MEQKLITAAARAMLTQAAQKRRVIPFVGNYNIRIRQRTIEIDVSRLDKNYCAGSG